MVQAQNGIEPVGVKRRRQVKIAGGESGSGRMPTLSELLTSSRLELVCLYKGLSDLTKTSVSAVVFLPMTAVRNGESPVALSSGSLVVVSGSETTKWRGRSLVEGEILFAHMARDGCAGLVIAGKPGSRSIPPQPVKDLAREAGVPILATTASLRDWHETKAELQRLRVMVAENRATQLGELVQQMPAQLADIRGMQRIVDWLASALDAQVMVSETDRVLAAAPEGAAEYVAQAIIRQSVAPVTTSDAGGPRTKFISLASATGSDTALAVHRRVCFGEEDLKLLQHAAKLLGLVDQAQSEFRAAADASHAARTAAVELLMDGEVDKARRVMGSLAPGLLSADSARVFIVGTTHTRRDAAVRACESATAGHALVIADPRQPGRTLVINPVGCGQDDERVSRELSRLVPALGPDASLGGSGIYSLSLLAGAFHEADTAQRLAVHQSDFIALSAQDTELVSLLPLHDAQRWARSLLQPLMQTDTHWGQLRETLPTALAYPYTVAARRLGLHRNTVTRHVARAAELLNKDFAALSDRIVVSLALEVVTHRELPEPPTGSHSTQVPTLRALLDTSEIYAWAETLLCSARADRRGLLATATTWLTYDAHYEPTARALGLSEATVRSHVRALEGYLSRDLSSLNGMRDLQVALHSLFDASDFSVRELCPAA
ncbi:MULTISPECIES: helix-turn-helix domain-containing protein [unclassified Streptomyces]|uniref:helix-turn-helix domain-containing protein n=1 Tax=unclassified Streptomyces TaxID=2593676 RepID=UPI00380497B7